jgi:hypothetical protein
MLNNPPSIKIRTTEFNSLYTVAISLRCAELALSKKKKLTGKRWAWEDKGKRFSSQSQIKSLAIPK